MQNTSQLYRRLLADENHWFETRLVVGEGGNLVTKQGEKIIFGEYGIVVSRSGPDSGYPENSIFSIETSSQIMENTMEIGKCVSQEIDVKMINPSGYMPRMSLVVLYVRICTEDEQSEWLQQGEFYIDTREISNNNDGLNVLTFHGYDAMMKANQMYSVSDLDWPATDTDVVREIAGLMGVDVDSRTFEVMTEEYSIQEVGTYAMIEVLGMIASMYLGNFIITETGELRLVTILEMPKETRHLIDHVGDVIVFGEDSILV